MTTTTTNPTTDDTLRDCYRDATPDQRRLDDICLLRLPVSRLQQAEGSRLAAHRAAHGHVSVIALRVLLALEFWRVVAPEATYKCSIERLRSCVGPKCAGSRGPVIDRGSVAEGARQLRALGLLAAQRHLEPQHDGQGRPKLDPYGQPALTADAPGTPYMWRLTLPSAGRGPRDGQQARRDVVSALESNPFGPSQAAWYVRLRYAAHNRVLADLTLSELAELSGLSRNTVRAIGRQLVDPRWRASGHCNGVLDFGPTGQRGRATTYTIRFGQPRSALVTHFDSEAFLAMDIDRNWLERITGDTRLRSSAEERREERERQRRVQQLTAELGDAAVADEIAEVDEAADQPADDTESDTDIDIDDDGYFLNQDGQRVVFDEDGREILVTPDDDDAELPDDLLLPDFR